jgi:hypothetical protein
MRTAFSKVPSGEVYLIDRKSAIRLAKTHFSELPLLVFETRHGPNMSAEIPYLVTYSRWDVRILSIRSCFYSAEIETVFREKLLPRVFQFARNMYESTERGWPWVVVVVGAKLCCCPCSDGMQFPDKEKIQGFVRKYPSTALLGTVV